MELQKLDDQILALSAEEEAITQKHQEMMKSINIQSENISDLCESQQKQDEETEEVYKKYESVNEQYLKMRKEFDDLMNEKIFFQKQVSDGEKEIKE